jgi:hypothetical protein
MFGGKKLLILVPAIVLIPVLLAMTPLTLIHKLSVGCPFSKGKTVEKCNSCPLHSIVSQNGLPVANLDSTLFQHDSTIPVPLQPIALNSIRSNVSFGSLPLRC